VHEAVGEDDRTQREELRRSLREARAAVPPDRVRAASAAVCAAVAALPSFARAGRVALYAAVRGEIDPAALRPILHARGAGVAYPRVVATDPPLLGFFDVDVAATLVAGRFGILEPAATSPVRAGELELILVPGIAFGRDGHRLGFGHGYYDAALAAAPRAVRVGLCHELQLVDHLPPRPGDEPVDFIVTPRERLTTRARPLPSEEVPS
jgi:5-formyltetrahydrofolate cyclo-ligase